MKRDELQPESNQRLFNRKGGDKYRAQEAVGQW